MKIHYLIFLLLTVSASAYGQQNKAKYYHGYVEEVGGMSFGYHSPLPDVKSSLLLRGQDNYAPIEWKTEVVPANYNDEFVSFIWVFGMDVTSDPVQFHLSVNGKPAVSFQNSKNSTIGLQNFTGKDGAVLTFNVTMLDNTADQMGFAILKIPVSTIELGASSVLKVEAEPADNNAWFMTFKTGVKESVRIYQNKVVSKSEGNLFHSICVEFMHVGAEAKAEISVGDIRSSLVLKAGYNKTDINLPKAEKPTTFTAEIQVDGRERISRDFSMAPVEEWEIFLVQHTHSDIGYTRPQTEILPEHLRYIDNALDFCDRTDHYPDAAKFRWTCETSWSVREYLRNRPQAQIDRLIQRIQEGRIEATGMFFNFSEIVDESALAAQTRTLRMLKNRGIDVTTAMQNDVNGIAWCMVDYYHNTDVKYLTMGIHAHRARRPFDKPTSFWWQSPAGNRLLAYRSEHYMHGNALSLTSGQLDVFKTNLSDYLKTLEEKNYPYNKISLQFSGYVTDNSPPSLKACEIIKEWNEKYEWPKLRSALAKDFMVYLDEQHAEDVPVHEVAWPDWWTDGVGSAANETKVVRGTHMEIAANTAIVSMAKMSGVELPDDLQEDIELVYDNLLFYDEHTHGAAESVSDPLALNTINQWGTKSSYAWEAAKRSTALQEKALALFEPVLGKADLPTIAVFNTLNWKRSEMVELFVQFEIIPVGADFTITDADGNEVPVQVFRHREEGAYYGLWVEDIPPMGYKMLQINVGQKGTSPLRESNPSFENDFYKLKIDESRGLVTQIFDKELEKDLLDPDDTLTLGQIIYEQLKNRHQLERLTNSNRDTVYRPLDLTRTSMSNIKLTKTENGAIFKSLFLHGDLPVCADKRGVTIEIRLYHYQKKIEFLYSMFKLPVYDPEGVYVSFPFKLDKGRLAFEAQGGVVYPGINQLEGSSSDWNTIQNFAAVKGDESQIVFVSNEIPLVQFGDINIGRYYYRLRPQSNHIYSWVLNNYWVTNFKASQRGELRWSYSITSSRDGSDRFATRFGWGDRMPVLSRIMLASQGAQSTNLISRSLINLDVPNLLLVNTTPSVDGRGIVLHVRELEGDHAVVDIRRLMAETGARSMEEVSVLEEVLKPLTSPLLIEHYETKFIKLNFVQ